MAGSRIAVIGGGAAGTLTAMALLRHTGHDVAIVEPGSVLGPGAPYVTGEPTHVLNTRAGAMSVDAEIPDDFVAWCRLEGLSISRDDFAPRQVYGNYLRSRAEATAARYPDRLRHIRARALAVDSGSSGQSDSWRVGLSDGDDLTAETVVLAMGTAPPAFPRRAEADVRDASGFVADPWPATALDAIAPDAEVLLLGTGLTAMDVVLSLAARGHTGPIMALSRHGLTPLPHSPVPTLNSRWPSESGERLGLGALIRAVRKSARGGDWRHLIDQIRLQANDIWAGFTKEEQDRFLRHVLRHWDVHRHRIAPSVAHQIERIRVRGTLTVHEGRMVSLARSGQGFAAHVVLSDKVIVRWHPDAVVNCTGPGHPAGLPLVRGLVADGLARADPLRLGIDVDPAGRVVRADGRSNPSLLAVGALRRGRWWETSAIPEIRAQAARLAQDLTHEPTPAR